MIMAEFEKQEIGNKRRPLMVIFAKNIISENVIFEAQFYIFSNFQKKAKFHS